MTDYIPGRIYSGVIEGKRELVIQRGPTFHYSWMSAVNPYRDDQVTDVRGPLVVLDLDGALLGYSVGNLVADLRSVVGYGAAHRLADIIEAQTKPPRIPEPTGFGAVVKDAKGEPYRRNHVGLWMDQRGAKLFKWEDIDSPVVVFAGVQS